MLTFIFSLLGIFLGPLFSIISLIISASESNNPNADQSLVKVGKIISLIGLAFYAVVIIFVIFIFVVFAGAATGTVFLSLL